jgi:hypothetical protein
MKEKDREEFEKLLSNIGEISTFLSHAGEISTFQDNFKELLSRPREISRPQYTGIQFSILKAWLRARADIYFSSVVNWF